eukprot:14685421-Alexandrium_andersonii.AAC.1
MVEIGRNLRTPPHRDFTRSGAHRRGVRSQDSSLESLASSALPDRMPDRGSLPQWAASQC